MITTNRPRRHSLAWATRSATGSLSKIPPGRCPLDAEVSGTARIVHDLPERVVVETDAAMPSYLVLSDTFDPGWSATVDGRPAPIRPAYLAFRAVFLPAGKHTVEFRYRPAGFALGAVLSSCGLLLSLILWLRPGRSVPGEPEHAVLSWPPRWRTWWFSALAALVLVSIAIPIGRTGPGRPATQAARRQPDLDQPVVPT